MAEPDKVAQIRLIIADVDTSNQLFTDEQIQTYLALSGGTVRLAAADALEAIAVSEVLISKKIQSQHLTTDGPAVAEALRKLAATQRQLAADEGDESAEIFDIVDTLASDARPEHTNYPYHEIWGL